MRLVEERNRRTGAVVEDDTPAATLVYDGAAVGAARVATGSAASVTEGAESAGREREVGCWDWSWGREGSAGGSSEENKSEELATHYEESRLKVDERKKTKF